MNHNFINEISTSYKKSTFHENHKEKIEEIADCLEKSHND